LLRTPFSPSNASPCNLSGRLRRDRRARMLRNNVGRMDAASKGFGAGRLDCGEADGQRRGPRVERLSSSAVPE
jgi:hypothetical protein